MQSINGNHRVSDKSLSLESSLKKSGLSSKWIKSLLSSAQTYRAREKLKDKIDGIPQNVSEHSLINHLFHARCPKDI